MADIADVVIACKRCETPFESGDMITYDSGKKAAYHANWIEAEKHLGQSHEPSCFDTYYDILGIPQGIENGMYWFNRNSEALLILRPETRYLEPQNGYAPRGEYQRVPGENVSGSRLNCLFTGDIQQKYFEDQMNNLKNNWWPILAVLN